MKKYILVLCCAILSISLSGCTKITDGYIIDKTETKCEQIDDLTLHDYIKYTFYVQYCNEGSAKTNKWFVSKAVYDKYKIGDYVTLEDVSDINN